MIDATARKWLRLAHRVRDCSCNRNQASWVSPVALSVWPAYSLRMCTPALRLSSS